MHWIRERAGGVELLVVAVPRASRTRVVGLHGDRLKVQLAAPPVDGEANAALLELFVKLFSVARQSVTLVDGEKSKRKTVRIEGVTAAEAETLLSPGR